MSKTVIRRYTVDDIDACIVGIEQFLAESRGDISYTNYCKEIDIDKEKLYSTLNGNINNADFFCSLIIVDEEIVGGLCAQISTPFYSSKRIAYDQILYVMPTYTNPKAITRLILSYIQWAKQRKAFECRLCSSTGFNQQGFTKLCQRFGFQQFEVGFARRF